MRVSIEIDDSAWSQFARDLFDKNLPFATSLAINNTIYATQQAVRSGMDTHYKGGPVGKPCPARARAR